MMKCFNVTGACDPAIHYMVDINNRLEKIAEMVDAGAYFVINRARQYGKTTTLHALEAYLKDKYVVISLDFQRLGNEEFETAAIFSAAFADYLVSTVRNRRSPVYGLNEEVLDRMRAASEGSSALSLRKLFDLLNELCETADKPIVLMIDEMDSATNNQVFLDFLAQLRSDYLNRRKVSAFQSVILAGVTDVKNIKRKIRADGEHRENSPWNIAADFSIDMSLSTDGISTMLKEYKDDREIEMNENDIAELLHDYTSGYPFLVSRICKLMDERLIKSSNLFETYGDVWTKRGVLEAVKQLESEKNPLFESLAGKLQEYPKLREMVYALLFQGREISYSSMDKSIDIALMFGFVKVHDNKVMIANRIFETVLYSMFLTEEQVGDRMYDASLADRNQFVKDGILDMHLILEKFIMHFEEIYGDECERFVEEHGRRLFLLYLRPIINGTGNYYIEAQTRDRKRTDIIIDYLGRQYIIELKIWRGNEYNARGEKQLAEYLDYYHQDIGYMLSFNFNKDKCVGIKTIKMGSKTLIEAVV